MNKLFFFNCSLFFEIFTEPEICHNYSYGVRAIVQCIPAWLRFIQCLRRYRDTKRAFPHLVNAGKYSTTFFTVTFAALYSTHKGIHWLWKDFSKCRFSPLESISYSGYLSICHASFFSIDAPVPSGILFCSWTQF